MAANFWTSTQLCVYQPEPAGLTTPPPLLHISPLCHATNVLTGSVLLLLACRSKWLMPKERLLLCQAEDRAKGLSEHHLQQLKVYFTQCRCCVACLNQVLGHSHHSPLLHSMPVGSPCCCCAAAAADIFDMANSIKLRQRVAATAVVYFRRLYAGSSFGAYDPHLVAPGCLYLASKVCVWLLNRPAGVCCWSGGGLHGIVQ